MIFWFLKSTLKVLNTLIKELFYSFPFLCIVITSHYSTSGMEGLVESQMVTFCVDFSFWLHH